MKLEEEFSKPMNGIPQFMGVRIKRREDPELMTGQAHYVADVPVDDALHMAIVRSPYAHAHIVDIDVEEALALDGVVGVFTAVDVNPNIAAPLMTIAGPGAFEEFRPTKRYPLAEKRVRHVGEPVAVVLAEDPYTTADAVELVVVTYEQLPALADPEAALAEDAPILHEDMDTNVAYRTVAGRGDVERAFAEAAVTVEVQLVNQRLIPNAMEPRAVLATYDTSADSVTVWTTTQVPHAAKMTIVKALDLSPDQVRVIGPNVGGGFGAKAVMYQEEILAPYLARTVGRPVRWAASRSEDYLATVHGRDQINRVALAADADGRVQALKLTGIADIGAYMMRVTPVPGMHTVRMATGTYRIPVVEAELRGVYTNKVSTEPYRGAGRPEAAYLIERAMDMLATALNLDPVVVRRRNYISGDDFPHRTATGLTYDTGNYAAALDKALEVGDYTALRAEQARRRKQGGPLLGIGIASYVEICGFGPWETGGVTVERDGSVTVRTGTMPNGQGHVTAWSQIVADTLQIPLERVTVKYGDTAEVARGVGTFGSRSTPVGGAAVATNAATVRDRALHIAAHLLEAARSDVTLEAGTFQVRGAPGRAVSWDEVVRVAYNSELPAEIDAELQADERFAPADETYPFGTHLCVVEVDPDTGDVTILRYISVDDCGNVINPLIVEGQVHGGAVQGIGQALFEAAVYDENANLVTGSLLDYAVPKAHQLPFFETHSTVTPTPLNPLGAKGIGEAATIGSTPAVVNAVVDALSHLGVHHLDMPLSSERIWRALNG